MLSQKGKVVCSFCMKKYNFKKQSQIKNLIKNFTLLSAANQMKSKEIYIPSKKELQIEEQNNLLRASIMVEIQQENPNAQPNFKSRSPKKNKQKRKQSEEIKKYGEDFEEEEKVKKSNNMQKSQQNRESEQVLAAKPPQIVVGQKCSMHNMPLHSWNPKKRKLLCTQCIEEGLKNDQNKSQGNVYMVLPQVSQQIRKRIISLKELVRLRRLQAKKIQKYIKDAGENAAISAKQDLAVQLSNLQELIGNVHKLLTDKMAGQCDRQQQNIKLIRQNIQKIKDNLSDHELVLNDISSHDDKQVIYFTDMLDEVYKKLMNCDINSNIDFSNIGISVSANESIFNQVGSYISSSVIIKSSPPYLGGEEVTPVRVIKEKKQNWICLKCYSIYTPDNIFCHQCQRFRQLSTFSNILYNSYHITEYELRYLQERRQQEKQMICERDAAYENNLNENNHSKIWYFINAEWLSEWKMFILNKQSKDIPARISPNSKIGILPPGPISNLKLLREINQKESNERRFKPKQGLKKFTDYRGVNERVWNLFMLLYSGGPCIVGKQYDIYQKVQIFIKKSEKVLQQQKRMNFKSAKTDLINNKSNNLPQNIKKQLLKKQQEKKPQIFGRDQNSISLANIQSFNERLTDQNIDKNKKNIFRQEQKRSARFDVIRSNNRNNIHNNNKKLRGQSVNISPFSRNPMAQKRLNERNDWQWVQRKKHNLGKKQQDASYVRKPNNGGRQKIMHLEEQEQQQPQQQGLRKLRTDRVFERKNNSNNNGVFDDSNIIDGQLQCRFQKKEEPVRKKEGNTLNKFVGIMRNIFNKE